MKIRTNIDNINGRYNVQVETFDFSAVELQKMQEFGEPLVDVGGAFNGTISRPGQVDTFLTVIGSHTSPAGLSPVILNGTIIGVTVIAPGAGYGSPTLTITGDGTGAVLTPLLGVVGLGSIADPGSGYQLNDFVNDGVGPNPIVLKVTGVDGGGGVTSVTIYSTGKEATSVNGVVSFQDGNGAGLQVDLTDQWGVTGATIISIGSGYNIVPTSVTFDLPTATRRLMSDFPAKQIFDLRDSPDSDVMARIWADTIVSLVTIAKNSLVNQSSVFEGETVITV